LVIEHGNRTAITVAHKGFTHEPEVVPHKAVDSNIEGTTGAKLAVAWRAEENLE
jgi:hypothetical protein